MAETYEIELIHVGFRWNAFEKNRLVAAGGETRIEAHENLIQELYSEKTGDGNGS